MAAYILLNDRKLFEFHVGDNIQQLLEPLLNIQITLEADDQELVAFENWLNQTTWRKVRHWTAKSVDWPNILSCLKNWDMVR